ncbi:hypothetical protein BD779DRAFT_1789731 [Infundibulicybe gibba]|nr:hypothetical protein BD779DRAFT_1789731 [Infundibulicybe gibba]
MVEYHQEPQYLNPPARCILFGRPPELLMKIFLYCLPPDEWGSFSVWVGGSPSPHNHFCSSRAWNCQSTTVGLEGFEFPWAQLTQLTIQVSGGIEALALFRNCRSLEVCHLSPNGRRTPHTPPRMKIIHHHLRTLIVEDGPFAEGLLGCLVTPALSTLEFIRGNTESEVALRSILLFIENSSAKLTSLTLCYLELSPQDLVDLSSLIPTIVELDLQGLSEESLESLDVESNLPYVMFPHLKQTVHLVCVVYYFLT